MILKVLIACEESQEVCKAFRELGHEAYSNDLIECSGGYPEWHLQMDCFEAIKLKNWDLIIAHPPCERLTCAANKYYKDEYKDRFPNIHKERIDAINFFMAFTKVEIKHLAIENPIGIMSTRYRKADQIIQPYWFGHKERKSTCLWLKDLPKLTATNIVQPDIIYHSSGRTDSRLHYETFKLPKNERRKARSKTFQGIAKAMAEQWSKYIIENK